MSKYTTKNLITEQVVKETGWSLLRSAYMNCWGACSSLATKEIDTTDGGIDAYNKAEDEEIMRTQDKEFSFATGLESQVDPIIAARQWMGVVETLYPMMDAKDRLHPREFIQERLNEKPDFEMSEADIAVRMSATGLTKEEILSKFKENSLIAWNKQSAQRERAAEIFKTIGAVEDAPQALIEKIEQFAAKRAKQAATDNMVERGNESLANIALIKQELAAAEEAIVTH
ncbi:MAG: hypothetical protein HOE82_08455 [Gammaproteobacteria bacterium]|jgi:hypothetical protein|nr:hypothetical protein [Gammaproteobacteria bacterium]